MSYNNNYNSNYGFGSNNYSNFTNYTTPRQDKVSQVVNLLEKCSIGELENIEKQLSYIKQRKKQEFYSNVYTFFLNYYNNVMAKISEEDLKVAMTYLNQSRDISYSNDCRQHLFNYMRLKRIIEKILSLRDYSYLYEISYEKDIKSITTITQQTFQNALKVINKIKQEGQYQQTLKSMKKTKEQEETAKAQAQEFMQENYQAWFYKILPLWIGGDNLKGLCEKVQKILFCKKRENEQDYDIEKIAGILGCQIKDVEATVQQFMFSCENFLRKNKQQQGGMYDGYSHQSPNNNYNGKNKGLGMETSGNTCGF